MARTFFFITVGGVLVYIAAVLFVLSSVDGADAAAEPLDAAQAAPVFVASSP